MKKINVSEKIYYVGSNDRKTALFENNWPLPEGVSYNSYLITDDKCALIDTLEYGSDKDYIPTIVAILQERRLDYLIVNHMEPDHSSMIGEILRLYPELKIVGNSKTYNMLLSYFNLSRESFMEVSDGETLDLGYHKLKFVITPWVHWPETMMTYDQSDKILFSCDAFGSFGALNGGIFDDEIDFSLYESEMRRYYSNIVGMYSAMVQKALTKLSGTEVKMVAPSHGPIWRKDPAKVISLYDKWSKYEAQEGVVIAFASMYGNTEKMAERLARELSESGVRNIRVYDVSKTHSSFILNDIWRYKGYILGSCSYNGDMHPMMKLLSHEIKVSNPQKRVFGIFGSHSWNSAGIKALKKYAEENKYEVTGEPIDASGHPHEEILSHFKEYAAQFVLKMKAIE